MYTHKHTDMLYYFLVAVTKVTGLVGRGYKSSKPDSGNKLPLSRLHLARVLCTRTNTHAFEYTLVHIHAHSHTHSHTVDRTFTLPHTPSHI